jgi:hypothetical protein
MTTSDPTQPTADEPIDLKARAANQALSLVDQELIAMREVFKIVYPLKRNARERVLRWALHEATTDPIRVNIVKEPPGV